MMMLVNNVFIVAQSDDDDYDDSDENVFLSQLLIPLKVVLYAYPGTEEFHWFREVLGRLNACIPPEWYAQPD
jgi:hypothetical protein